MAEEFFSYKPNIFVLDRRAYRREVVRVLERIKTTRCGQTLLDFIDRRSNKWLAILPFEPTDDDPVNAYEYADNKADGAPKNHFLWQTITLTDENETEVRLPAGLGTGKGSSAYIEFHPATYREKMRRQGGLARTAGPGEALFHEMIHAFRDISGATTMTPLPDRPGMDNIEEFYAILAANVYRSERGFTSLRLNHQGWSPLGRVMSISDTYYEEYKPLIDDWFSTQRAFCLAMARSPASFNPFTSAAVALGLMSAPGVPMALP